MNEEGGREAVDRWKGEEDMRGRRGIRGGEGERE